ncbi:MAG: AraC family transcriptional regulator [Bacteroidales bacterium]|nr:AraC family transcriptional regulator [Bacteroidales bacterium]MBN2763530.1 AraC family transcriptional regulator [Bacteroidales bacterium]
METIAWVGFSQSLFAALLIMTKREWTVSDKLLSGWLCLLAIEFLTCALDYNIFGKPLLSSSFLLFNPAFYLYISSLTNKDFHLKYIQLLHLLPFLFFEVGAYVIQETIAVQSFLRSDTTLGFRLAFGVANIISYVVYNYLSLRQVIQHRKNIFNEFSTIENYISLGWLLFIIVFYTTYCSVSFIIGITVVFQGTNLVLPHIFNYAALLFLIYALGFYGLWQKPIFTKITDEEMQQRYKYSALSMRKKKDIKNKIIGFFDDTKPYLQSDLNMDILSEALQVPKHHLTEVLNTEIGKNFFQFVNGYRVEAVKAMLADKKNFYSIEAIGYECGFNSKSSFFTVFKNLTGQTPLEYRNSLSEVS